jgi:hypothetical protein
MAWKWFVQKDDFIDGPFTTEEVQHRLSVGQLGKQHLIWAAGLDHWQNLQSWLQNLPTLGMDSNIQPIMEAWHFAVNGQSKGPMTRSELVNQVKDLGVGDVMVWTKGMKEWAPLYEFHDLLTEIGLNKRQFPRADLDGKAIIKGNGSTLIAPLLSISEGGFGVALENGVVQGENMNVEIQSPVFRESLHCKAEVRYVANHVVGFKFTAINVETKGAVIQFIKQSQNRFTIRAA